jgi:hypothetical protein
VGIAQIAPYLTGPVAALIVLAWVFILQRQDLADMKKALEDERKRADSAEEAARTMNALLSKVLDGRKAR